MFKLGNKVVLWPNDTAVETGFIYGWSEPMICVAGLIPTQERSQADEILLSLGVHQASANQKLCIDIIGYSPGENRSEICFFGDDETSALGHSLVYYQRPDLYSMEIYSLDFRIYDTSGNPNGKPSRSSRSAAPTAQDFTIPPKPAGSLDPLTVDRLNEASYFAHKLAPTIAELRGKKSRNFKIMYLLSPLTKHISLPPLHIWLAGIVRGSVRMLGPVIELARTVELLLAWVSSTGHQADIRLEQITSIPAQVPQIYHHSTPASSDSISFYVNFWNETWLILNDIIIGYAACTVLCENAVPLSNLSEGPLLYWLVEFPQYCLIWLNNWPAGLKLNTELSQFYCHTLLGIVAAWGDLLKTLVFPYLPVIIYLIGALGSCGLTMTVSALSDFLGILTAHLYACYLLSAVVFSRQLAMIGSLWNLFRGKRYNVLRKRKDSWDYDVDQLVLGTILFTLVTFLSPTIIAYYLSFAAARFLVITAHAVLDTVLVLMNHFPLFALLLRIKSPHRMPGGITFRITRDQKPMLDIRPISFTTIFGHYGYLGSRLFAHYHPLRLMRLILGGGHLSPVPRHVIRLRSMYRHADTATSKISSSR